MARARLASLDRAFEELVSYSDGSPPDDEHDPEGATVAWERGQISALREQAAERVRGIESALGRLEQGTYGRCEVCGVPIEAERLEARPASLRCVACAG